MVLLLLMVIQIGVWYHTRAVAQTAARHGLDHVRTLDGSTGDGIAVADEFLAQSGGGLEGAQVVRLHDRRFLLTAVCFLRHGRPGRRQRLFTALADRIEGPYLGSTPVIEPSRDAWDCGENGHGCAWQKGDDIHVFFQARRPAGKWNIGTGQLTGL